MPQHHQVFDASDGRQPAASALLRAAEHIAIRTTDQTAGGQSLPAGSSC